MVSKSLFGTDGIRGIFGISPLTLAELWSIGYGIGLFLKSKHEKPYVVIGHDTRKSYKIIQDALCGGLVFAGVFIESVGVAPTPAISFLTKKLNAHMGLVISASHNTHEYNGIKFFNENGGKFSRQDEWNLENFITLGNKKSGSSYTPSYCDHIFHYKNFVSTVLSHSLNGLRIVLDCANGAFTNLAATVFRQCGAIVVHELGNAPNGININDRVGSLHTEIIPKAVVEYGADLGVSFDGDGDRVLIIDNKGNVADGDQILGCLSLTEGIDGVVGTVMSNLGLEKFLEYNKIPFIRADVGDRNIAEKLLELGWSLGGEPCGHIIINSVLPTGDGLIGGLFVAEHVAKHGQTFPIFSPTPSITKNIPLKNENVMSLPGVQDYVSSVEENLRQNGGRLLLRSSGTEPLLRLMIEGANDETIGLIADTMSEYLEKAQIVY